MNTSKKYHIQITENGDSWCAEINRRVTSKKTITSKKQEGFASEAQAKSWADQQLTLFLQNLNERNKRRSGQ